MAPQTDPPLFITLRIKVQPGQIALPDEADEFTLGDRVPVLTRIGQVRERIQATLPAHPTPETQRMLYSGRALVDNEQTLADALNIRRDPTQQEYVVHLVVKGEGLSTTPVPQGRNGSNYTGSVTQPVLGTGVGLDTQGGMSTASGVQQQLRQPHVPPHTQNPYAAEIEQLRLQAQAMRGANRNLSGPFPSHGQGVNTGGFGTGHPGHGPALTGTPETNPVNPSPPPTIRHEGPQNRPSARQAEDNAMRYLANPGLHPSLQPPVNGQDLHLQGVGPNGDRITIHRQTLNFRHTGTLGQQMPHWTQNTNVTRSPGPRGLPDNAMRERILRMQDRISELNNSTPLNDAQRSLVTSLEREMQSLSASNLPAASIPRSPIPEVQYAPPPTLTIGGADPSHARRTGAPLSLPTTDGNTLAPSIHTGGSSSSNLSDVFCWLLSSPQQAPTAVLYVTQRAVYRGSSPHIAELHPTPTVPGGDRNAQAAVAQAHANSPALQGQGMQRQDEAVQQIQQAAPQLAQQAQQQAPAQQDPLGPLGPIVGHLWLLLRILIFSYFLLGANLGWRRPLALVAIGVGFWMIRAGLLGDGGAIRRWWDGIVNDAQPAQQQEQNQAQQPDQAAPAENARPGQMPTPEQLAQRILNNEARARNQAHHERFLWIRERVRPVERAVALLVASLWPGVGEAYVRAREQEERRRAEEEVAARRREEEEKQRLEEEEKDRNNESGENKDKAEGAGEQASTATEGNEAIGAATAQAGGSSSA